MLMCSGESSAPPARTLHWRRVPTDLAAVLPAQRSTTPVVLQVVAGFDGSRKKVNEALYRARLRIERIAREEVLRASIASLSTRTSVYKGLVTPDALPLFYPDLTDARFASNFIVFHQRLRNQHVGRLGAGAAAPARRAQRRNQHDWQPSGPRRQVRLTASPRLRRSRSRTPRRESRLKEREALTERRIANTERAFGAACRRPHGIGPEPSTNSPAHL